MKKFFLTIKILIFFKIFLTPLTAEKFLHPSDVVREVQKKFRELNSYSAKFQIEIKENQKNRLKSGMVYYSKGGKVNFTFEDPSGDIIISDGKKLWVYISRLKAVGVQDLRVKTENKFTYDQATPEGVLRLFQRYHYRFLDSRQPTNTPQGSYYVLELKEKVASGSYEKIYVYVNPQTHLIEKLIAYSPSGREVKLSFSQIELNPNLPVSLFQFNITENMRVVENPLASEG